VSELKWDEDLIQRLTELAKPENPNRAVLAHLRRGLAHHRRGVDATLDYTLGRVGWLFRRVPESREDKLLRSAVCAAGLFAWVKGDCSHVGNVNFGTAFGTGLNQDQKQQRERRFIDLLDTDADELPYKLRQAITLIVGVGLDWVRLIWDLVRWSNEDRPVQKDWARGFWSAPEAETTAEQEQTVSE
jgi:CRISPR system Cascade subunit CasB